MSNRNTCYAYNGSFLINYFNFPGRYVPGDPENENQTVLNGEGNDIRVNLNVRGINDRFIDESMIDSVTIFGITFIKGPQRFLFQADTHISHLNSVFYCVHRFGEWSKKPLEIPKSVASVPLQKIIWIGDAYPRMILTFNNGREVVFRTN